MDELDQFKASIEDVRAENAAFNELYVLLISIKLLCTSMISVLSDDQKETFKSQLKKLSFIGNNPGAASDRIELIRKILSDDFLK